MLKYPHMNFDSYQRLSRKTFFVLLLQNSFAAITVTFVWLAFVFIKTLKISTFSFFSNAQDTVALTSTILDFAIVLGLILVLLSWLIALIDSIIRYFTFYFMLSSDGIIIKQGLLHIKEISIPYRHIEDININQSLLYQVLRVCKLNMLTSGQDQDNNPDHSSEIEFPVMEKTLADDLKKELLTRSNIQITSEVVK